ncbi:pre-mRNA-splicing factor 38A-like [Cottoperca gobio]|uniref:Pre-mRNA-splicing factor 38B n=1 Tax=Cottoperca gobio TaxID=56716 RepID=A0A6J2PD46_COTGO|nr:pre-mRNA-splicing factor 38A-like [Cottoperca gobio]
MELKFVGGVFGGNIKPTPFLCLTLKMLQIQPEKDIIVEFIKNEDFKYVRLLGAMYMRLTGTTVDCYKYLEPLYNDYRRVKSQNRNGEFELMHVDEFIDELLHSERMCDIILPRLQKRHVLEEAEMLDPRISALEEDLDEVESSEEEDEEEEKHWTQFAEEAGSPAMNCSSASCPTTSSAELVPGWRQHLAASSSAAQSAVAEPECFLDRPSGGRALQQLPQEDTILPLARRIVARAFPLL